MGFVMIVRDIYFSHNGSSGNILNGVSITARKGEITVVLGPNGSGKTTLFNCITGLWRPVSGSVSYRGKDITHVSHKKRAEIISVVPQDHEPPFPYTVFDAVLMGRAAHVGMFSTPSVKDGEITSDAIDMMGISGLAYRPYTKISGGERQLALIARGIAQDAPVMVLDEPTSHLDLKNQIMVLDRVHETVKARGLTVLMTVHDPNLAMIYSDHVVMLHAGTVLAAGRPADVLNNTHLQKMYGKSVTVFNWKGMKVVHPGVKKC